MYYFNRTRTTSQLQIRNFHDDAHRNRDIIRLECITSY